MTNLLQTPPPAAPTVGEIAAPNCPITNPLFFFGGKAIFTVAGPSGRFTFRASRPKKGKTPNPPVFIGVLTGPDNTANYTYMGILNVKGEIVQTYASKFAKAATQVKVAEWAIRQVIAKKPLPAGYSIHHEGKCCRCGRTLTTPESCAAGIGPECASKVGG